MKKNIWVASITTSAIAAGVLLVVLRGGKEADKANATEASPPLAVKVVQPRSRSLTRVVEQPGMVQAYEETRLFARVPGYLSEVKVDIGAKIDAKKVLAEIAVPELEAEVRQKLALVKQANAEVERARKALASAAAAIKTMDASVVEARAFSERWDLESKRIAGLVTSGVVDKQAHDEVQHQQKAAAARVLSAEAGVLKATADRDKAAADVSAAEAHVEVASAEAQRAEATLGFAKIRAPYDGVVTARKANTGDFVQPAGGKGDWLLTVARLNPVRIVIAVPEADAGLVVDKAEVKFDIPALYRTGVAGNIARTSWALDSAARTLRAEIDMDNKGGLLRPGMYVLARITIHCPKCWTLPVAAVTKQGEDLVCFVEKDGKIVRTPVQTGRSDGVFIEVSFRRKDGSSTTWEEWTGTERVAASAAGLTDGQPVRATLLKE